MNHCIYLKMDAWGENIYMETRTKWCCNQQSTKLCLYYMYRRISSNIHALASQNVKYLSQLEWNQWNWTENIKLVLEVKLLAVIWMIRIHSCQGRWFSSLPPCPPSTQSNGYRGSFLRRKTARMWSWSSTSVCSWGPEYVGIYWHTSYVPSGHSA